MIKSEKGDVVESVTIGEYELILVNIWGDYQVALTHSDLSFFTPHSQDFRRDMKNNPATKFPFKSFVSTLKEWCNKYGTLVVGSYKIEKLDLYKKILDSSNLFDVVDKSPNEVYINTRK